MEATTPLALKRKPPSDRSPEQLWNHYLVERELAARLKSADRAQRRDIYATMYSELFSRVPDHTRLTRRVDEKRTRATTQGKLSLLGSLLRPDDTFLEIAPGDCRFLSEIAQRVRLAWGVDISDQRAEGWKTPDNVRLVVYDGHDTREIPDGSVDLAFSDQLLEHLHPEDMADHLRFVRRLLKPGGRYLFRTPHAGNGPHDVSAYFCDEPEGFHLKEWTYGELADVLEQTGYRAWRGFWAKRNLRAPLPFGYFTRCERVLQPLPRKIGRPVSRWLTPSIEILAQA